MRRRVGSFFFALALLALPAVGAQGVSTGDEPTLSWQDVWSEITEWVVGLVTGESGIEDGDGAELGPWADPNGSHSEPTPPSGEVGPIADPDG